MRPVIQFSCRVTALMLAVLWLCQTPLWAGIYKWKDDQGKIHFTDDKSNIPLKYRNKLEKFKGVTEPKVDIPEPEGEPEASAGEEPGGQTPDPQAAAPKPEIPQPTQEYSHKERAFIKEVRDSLMKEWGSHVSLLRELKVTKENEKYHAQVAQKSAANKQSLAGKIRRFRSDLPHMKEIRTYLKKSRIKDLRLKMDSDLLKIGVEKYRKRLTKEVKIEREFVDTLRVELELEESPLPTLEEELKKAVV